MEKINANKKPKEGMRKVLLLASYCHDNSKCYDEKPCLDCLSMCNTFHVSGKKIKTENYSGTLDYLI